MVVKVNMIQRTVPICPDLALPSAVMSLHDWIDRALTTVNPSRARVATHEAHHAGMVAPPAGTPGWVWWAGGITAAGLVAGAVYTRKSAAERERRRMIVSPRAAAETAGQRRAREKAEAAAATKRKIDEDLAKERADEKAGRETKRVERAANVRKAFKEEQATRPERERIKLENAERARHGLEPLPLPPLPGAKPPRESKKTEPIVPELYETTPEAEAEARVQRLADLASGKIRPHGGPTLTEARDARGRPLPRQAMTGKKIERSVTLADVQTLLPPVPGGRSAEGVFVEEPSAFIHYRRMQLVEGVPHEVIVECPLAESTPEERAEALRQLSEPDPSLASFDEPGMRWGAKPALAAKLAARYKDVVPRAASVAKPPMTDVEKLEASAEAGRAVMAGVESQYLYEVAAGLIPRPIGLAQEDPATQAAAIQRIRDLKKEHPESASAIEARAVGLEAAFADPTTIERWKHEGQIARRAREEEESPIAQPLKSVPLAPLPFTLYHPRDIGASRAASAEEGERQRYVPVDYYELAKREALAEKPVPPQRSRPLALGKTKLQREGKK